MAIETNLFFNVSTQSFVASIEQPTPIPTPEWYNGDTKHILLKFVKNGVSGSSSVSVVPASGLGLVVAMGTPGGTPLTSVTPAAPVNDVFTFDIPLTTAAVDALFSASVLRVSTTLEFQTSDSGYTQRYQTPLILKENVISGTLTDPAPGQTAISTAAANATYVKKIGSAGDYQIMVSPSGLQFQVYMGDDGQLHADPLT